MNSKYVFPSPRGQGPITTRALLLRLRRAGIKTDELTTHGFRSMASTILNEGVHIQGYSKDAIEMQLAHKDTTQRGVYNHAAYFDARVEMMQEWADYLDTI
jgi:integrase